MLDKREWRRFDIELEAVKRSLATSQLVNVMIINVNQQGFCFVSESGHEPGDKVELTMMLKGAGLTRLLTEVAWSGFFQKSAHYRTGVRIITDDEVELEKFLKFYNLKLLCAPKPSSLMP
jgi:hypothetical protein